MAHASSEHATNHRSAGALAPDCAHPQFRRIFFGSAQVIDIDSARTRDDRLQDRTGDYRDTPKDGALNAAQRNRHAALLKATGMATSGGEAKAMVAAGKVQVDGQLELRKRCKIRVGQVVSLGESSIRVIERT